MQQRICSENRTCLRDGTIRKFQYREVQWEGTWHLAIQRGCDSQDASSACIECIKAFDAEYQKTHQSHK